MKIQRAKYTQSVIAAFMVVFAVALGVFIPNTNGQTMDIMKINRL